MKMKRAFALLTMVSMTACATHPDRIPVSYSSPMQYQDYNCNQITGELQRVSRRVDELHGSLAGKASGDAWQMGIGLVLFWPALLFLEFGDGPDATEYGRLRGERESLEKTAIQKECGMTPTTASAPAAAPAAATPTAVPAAEATAAASVPAPTAEPAVQKTAAPAN